MTLPGAVRTQIAGISTQEDALAVERTGAERPDGSTDHERVRAFVAAVRSAV